MKMEEIQKVVDELQFALRQLNSDDETFAWSVSASVQSLSEKGQTQRHKITVNRDSDVTVERMS